MRKTYVYDPNSKRMVEGRAPRPRDTGDRLMSDRLYDKLPPAHDGSPINTKTRHRNYMKRNGLTTIDDFSKTWAKREQQRKDFYAGRDDKQTRHERASDVAQAMEQRKR